MYRLLWNQCSDQLQAVIRQQKGWNKVSEDKDPIKLRLLIRMIMLNLTDAVHPVLRAVGIQVMWLTLFQSDNMALPKFDEMRKATASLMRDINNGELLVPFDVTLEELRKTNPVIAKAHDDDQDYDPRVQNPVEWKAARKTVEDRFDAGLCFKNLNSTKHGSY